MHLSIISVDVKPLRFQAHSFTYQLLKIPQIFSAAFCSCPKHHLCRNFLKFVKTYQADLGDPILETVTYRCYLI